MSGPYEPLRHWAQRPHWATFHRRDQQEFRQGLADARHLPGFTLAGLETFIRTETNKAEIAWSTKDLEKVIGEYMFLARSICRSEV